MYGKEVKAEYSISNSTGFKEKSFIMHLLDTIYKYQLKYKLIVIRMNYITIMYAYNIII